MPKKHIKTDGHGSALNNPKIDGYKAKPKPWVEMESIRQYRLKRERLFWQEYPEQRSEIEQRVKEWLEEWKRQDKKV